MKIREGEPVEVGWGNHSSVFSLCHHHHHLYVQHSFSSYRGLFSTCQPTPLRTFIFVLYFLHPHTDPTSLFLPLLLFAILAQLIFAPSSFLISPTYLFCPFFARWINPSFDAREPNLLTTSGGVEKPGRR